MWIAVGAWFLLPESWINPVWYAAKYGVDLNQVHTSDKPSNCEWSRSPLGIKGCHYDRVVNSYSATGDLIAVDAAVPTHSHDRAGKPIISYDGGKTWKWVEPATTIKRVDVDWVKVTE